MYIYILNIYMHIFIVFIFIYIYTITLSAFCVEYQIFMLNTTRHFFKNRKTVILFINSL